VKGIQICSNKRPGSLQRRDNHKKYKNGLGSFKNLILIRTMKPEKLNFTLKLSDLERKHLVG
jgi:hypothetical protein